MKKLIKYTNCMLAGLLTLLGFSNCSKFIDDEQPLEYGVPHANFTVKGKVIDKSNNKPIKGIRVGYSPVPNEIAMYGVYKKSYQPMTLAADTTDINGEFKLTTDSFVGDTTVPVYIEDIDGAENGSYASDTLAVNFKEAVQTGKPDGHWYDGEYTVTVQVELEELKPNE